ncbi:MAG: DNA alkylation repair protein [Candidatus Doudnabacteria bacterium]|nr:DNA alkylation repair protein [Candidatus Doudnabacteria bacterium]
MLKELLAEIKKDARPARARVSQWFFKTKPGQYGHGDVFVGLTVPQMRKLAKKYEDLKLPDIQKLLKSKVHEHRFIALTILVFRFVKSDSAEKNKIAGFYLGNTKNINNWDLVDTSAPYILGEYLLDKSRQILYTLARSQDLWERRISIVSTLRFIKNNQYEDTLKISEILLEDKHDLIHKAVGWMLREAGKKDEKVLVKFLNTHYKSMPRTALRYAIERLPIKQKKFFMAK